MNIKGRLTLGIIGCTLLALLTPSILTAQASENIPMGTERRPQECLSRSNPKKGAPNVTQVKMYLTCDNESSREDGISTSIYLIDDITVQIAPTSRRFLNTDLVLSQNSTGYLSIDTDKPIYDIRGSYTSYSCSNGYFKKVGQNCKVERISGSTGICFLDSFSDWHCRLVRGSHKTIGERLPPPAK